MPLFGSPYQVKVTSAESATVDPNVDVFIETGTGKTVTLPLAHLCTAEQGNNIVRVVAVGNSLTLDVQSGNTFINSANDTGFTITDGAVAYCESDGQNQWIVTGRTS